uniref:Uncharacterized protein n=1 Tax=Lepeophtheirus salmonis TaxID=72036 RepID=A0A0K2V8F3_LEPSM
MLIHANFSFISDILFLFKTYDFIFLVFVYHAVMFIFFKFHKNIK